ncbi:Na(+)-translocating NADH-quinone reductase subunit C [Rubripirellula obstinata]|uniref:Na(+)-translocating NADH-quinone reductase subunit C n=1 Tax=Rubripirellula obstinata TaxID=406547 RepID=A0A5B1CCU3_9BACT|nr:Na(+)-translocating NADH-quinone reductase subunit C [Rubripirellula obstinata]KAA1258988.1 Na(+)-translocating NADH-quinone reductase subunit C [Rubripirellula obstinata]
MQQRDSLGYTLMAAAVLCVVCSLAVSAAAVALRPIQEANEKLDQQKNILDAAGLAIGEYGKVAGELEPERIKELYGWVSEKMVSLESGTYDVDANPDTWKLMDAMSNPATSIAITDPEFDPGEERRPETMKVFFVKRPGSDSIQQVVLPIYGKGLWGTLYGYLALKSDLKTIQGITFYQHKETPGLGGEVDNPRWKAQWDGVHLYDEDGNPAANVFKGPAPTDNVYAVDGLSGATITCRGVTNLVRYWAGDDAYGPFLTQLKSEMKESEQSDG